MVVRNEFLCAIYNVAVNANEKRLQCRLSLAYDAGLLALPPFRVQED
jgi:hypothetical protein